MNREKLEYEVNNIINKELHIRCQKLEDRVKMLEKYIRKFIDKIDIENTSYDKLFCSIHREIFTQTIRDATKICGAYVKNNSDVKMKMGTIVGLLLVKNSLIVKSTNKLNNAIAWKNCVYIFVCVRPFVTVEWDVNLYNSNSDKFDMGFSDISKKKLCKILGKSSINVVILQEKECIRDICDVVSNDIFESMVDWSELHENAEWDIEDGGCVRKMLNHKEWCQVIILPKFDAELLTKYHKLIMESK